MFPTGKTRVVCLRVGCERVCTLVQFLLRLSFLRSLTTWLKSFWLRGKTRGPRKNGSLLSWRAVDNKSSEPRAYALAFVNPHNICYANAVLHVLHQARSRAGLITGLGDLNGSLMQATRSNQAVNIARDPAWSFVWPGWQRPTRQRDAAEFLQHLCQRAACAALQGGWEARRHGEGAYAVLDE